MLPMLSTTLAFYIEINYLSRKRALNSSCRMSVLLSSKREKRRITEVKIIAMPTKQIKQRTRTIMVAIPIRQTVLLLL